MKSSKLFLILFLIYYSVFNAKIQRKCKDCDRVFSSKTNNETGKKFRVFLLKNQKVKSFWHNISLKNNDKTFNMVVEIPKETTAKYEMSKEEDNNPIKQDLIKKTKQLRFYKIDPIFNYGFFPKTWENSVKTYFKKYKGDDDPYDVVEIGKKKYITGQIVKVRVLSSFCLIDHGEVDWKILVVNENEYDEYKKDKKLYDELIKKIMEWFKVYKTYEGKKYNKILFNDKLFDESYTKDLIEEGYNDYKKLKNKLFEGLDYSKYHF